MGLLFLFCFVSTALSSLIGWISSRAAISSFQSETPQFFPHITFILLHKGGFSFRLTADRHMYFHTPLAHVPISYSCPSSASFQNSGRLTPNYWMAPPSCLAHSLIQLHRGMKHSIITGAACSSRQFPVNFAFQHIIMMF